MEEDEVRTVSERVKLLVGIVSRPLRPFMSEKHRWGSLRLKRSDLTPGSLYVKLVEGVP